MSTRSGRLTPEQQVSVLARVWDIGEGGYVFLPWIPGTTNSKAERRASWNEGPAFVWPADRPKILEHVRAHQRDDLYFSVNLFLHPSRVVQHVGESYVLYADLDEVDPRTDIDVDMRPSIAWESSPDRFQAIWVMDGMSYGASDPGGLNHRLTAAIGADPSGWDTTQVLRVPGKANYKFDYKDEESGAPVPGRLLWYSDKRYGWQDFEDRLPVVKTYDTGGEVEASEVDAIDRHAVWGRVRMKCAPQVREFMSMKARQIDGSDHDRSEVLWQIERELADAGCSVVEIIAIVRGTGWNKYSGRRNELAQLRAEASKAVGVAQEEADEDNLEGEVFSGARPKVLPTLADLTSVSIPRPHWLIRKVWTRGSCGFISGQPKSYKSYVGLDMAISVATGTPFLNEVQFSTGRPRKVIYLQEEDSLPLVLHRAEQVVEEKASDHHWHGQLTLGTGEPVGDASDASGGLSDLLWTPGAPLDTLAMLVRAGFVASDPVWQAWLAEQVVDFGADLVVIDTLGTTVGDIDADKSGPLNDRVLKPLKLISEQSGCAIAIIHHNRKASDDKARSGQQMLGSVALHAWVESALYVQAKEQLIGQPATVKIERENKLAEDMKFRMMIPTMFTERGDEQEGRRQMWEPTVLMGWGEAEKTAEESSHTTSRSTPVKRGKNREGVGARIANKMEAAGGRDTPIHLSAWADMHNAPNRLKQYRKEASSAVSRGFLTRVGEDIYQVTD